MKSYILPFSPTGQAGASHARIQIVSNTSLQVPMRHLCDQPMNTGACMFRRLKSTFNGCSSAVHPEEEEESIHQIAYNDARSRSSSSDGQREERSRQRRRRRRVIEELKSSSHGPRRNLILRTIEEDPERISNAQTSSSSSAIESDENRRRKRLAVFRRRHAQFLAPLPQSYLLFLKPDGGTDDELLPVDWDVESVVSAQL